MAAFLPADTGTNIVTGVTGAITDNLPIVLPVLAFAIGLTVVRGFVNRAKRGRV